MPSSNAPVAVKVEVDQPDDPMSDDEQVRIHFHSIRRYPYTLKIYLTWVRNRLMLQMVIAEEPPLKDSHDIDLKCAEKVTDSDNEDAFDTKDIKSESKDGQPMSASGSKATDGSDLGNDPRDFTLKPKPIKAQRQTIDSPSSSYKQNSIYAFNSPKNPTGILPFQPTGNLVEIASLRITKFIE